MYLSPEFTDSWCVDKWGRIYIGPVVIVSISKDSQRYQGREIDQNGEEGNLTRMLPPSHLKVFSEPESIILDKKGRYGEDLYLVEQSNHEHIWLPAEYVPSHLIEEYKENQLLGKIWNDVKETEYQKILKEVEEEENRLIQQQQRINRKKDALLKWQQQRYNLISNLEEDFNIPLEE